MVKHHNFSVSSNNFLRLGSLPGERERGEKKGEREGEGEGEGEGKGKRRWAKKKIRKINLK